MEFSLNTPGPLAQGRAFTEFAVIGDKINLGRAAFELGLKPALVSSPEGSAASISTDNDQALRPDVQGVYKVRFGNVGSHGCIVLTFFAGPRSVETHHAYKVTHDGVHTGRRVLKSVFANTPLAQLDLSNISDATPWPREQNSVTGEWCAPDFGHHGG